MKISKLLITVAVAIIIKAIEYSVLQFVFKLGVNVSGLIVLGFSCLEGIYYFIWYKLTHKKINAIKYFKNSIELHRNCFGTGQHRGYHPTTKVRCCVTKKQLHKWLWLFYKDKKVVIRRLTWN